MLLPSIKSRPVYGKLKPLPGQAHLLVADGEGALAVLDLARDAPAEFLGKADIIYVACGPDSQSLSERLEALRARSVQRGPSVAAIVPRLTHIVSTSRMGMQVYLAGSEGLIGEAMKIAMAAGIPYNAIVTEHRGSLARRVQCVHCKGITENVTTQPVVCSHCGLNLLVRDHYSRRIAAFQGVCIDAEEPGSAPEPKEIFR